MVSVGLRSLRWSPEVSGGLRWSPVVSGGLRWSSMVSVSLRSFRWSPVVSVVSVVSSSLRGLPQFPVVFRGLSGCP